MKHAVQTYSRSVGAGCSIMDEHGEYLVEDHPGKRCELCRMMQDRGKKCASAHLYGTYQAERFGGRYIFSVPSVLCTGFRPSYAKVASEERFWPDLY